jgi:endoglucanase
VLIGLLLVVAVLSAALAAPARSHSGLHVSGNRLMYGEHVVQLRGVNRSGLESQCIDNEGFFESPHPDSVDSQAMIAAMLRWNINVVRVPLNEDCWLGVNAPRQYSGARYRQIVERYVHALERAHLFVILDLHWAAPGKYGALGEYAMADRDHSPAFWRSVARAFRGDGDVIFDLYNEPHGISWACWLHGCHVAAMNGQPAYQTAGMQQLVDAVRSTGARQPLMLGGINLALDLGGWLAHEPRDPAHQLIAAEHTYGGPPVMCDSGCQKAIVRTLRRVPVVMGELGESDCADSYVDPMMRFDDAHGVGYAGWAWDAYGDGWKCSGGQAMITDWEGTPSPYGTGFRNHFLALGKPVRPG